MTDKATTRESQTDTCKSELQQKDNRDGTAASLCLLHVLHKQIYILTSRRKEKRPKNSSTSKCTSQSKVCMIIQVLLIHKNTKDMQ